MGGGRVSRVPCDPYGHDCCCRRHLRLSDGDGDGLSREKTRVYLCALSGRNAAACRGRGILVSCVREAPKPVEGAAGALRPGAGSPLTTDPFYETTRNDGTWIRAQSRGRDRDLPGPDGGVGDSDA